MSSCRSSPGTKARLCAGSTGSNTNSLLKVATWRLPNTRSAWLPGLRAPASPACSTFRHNAPAPSADGRGGGRAVGQVEAAIVLGAFDDAALGQAVGQVVVAMGANAVGGIQRAAVGAHQGVGFSVVVE